jgi:hypothetical protein
MIRRILVMLVASVFTVGHGFAQAPPGPLPNGTREPEEVSEDPLLDAAVNIAKQIADARKAGSGGAAEDGGKAEANLDAWEKARKAGRLVIILETPSKNLRAWTWPDSPCGRPPCQHE